MILRATLLKKCLYIFQNLPIRFLEYFINLLRALGCVNHRFCKLLALSIEVKEAYLDISTDWLKGDRCNKVKFILNPEEENIFLVYIWDRRFSFMGKVLVDVLIQYTAEGGKVPLGIQWGDGRMSSIDRVIDVRKNASLNVEGRGLRYTCRVKGKQMYLYSEDELWYVETTQ